MKIALVHDHLIQEGGAEKVLEVFQEIWPDAPIYTLLYDEQKLGKVFSPEKVKTSYLQRWPGSRSYYKLLLPFMPTATESYNLMDYDVVLSSCSAMAKGIITRSNTLHFCYCHTPTRYLWSDTHQYLEELNVPSILKKFLPSTLTRLRMWDQLAAQRVDYFFANSKNVSDRIKKYYRRDSRIIHPPVDVDNFSIRNKLGNFFLTGGRLVPYKRFDLTIKAFNRLGIPLKIFGVGPEEENLKKLAKGNIEFLGKVNNKILSELYATAIAFIHPQIEDFGLTAIESMASGRPVIAFRAGGACETVVEGKTGTFFEDQTWESLADTVVRFKPEQYKPLEIKTYADQFSTMQFKEKIAGAINSEYKKLLQYQIECGFKKDLF